MLLVCHSDLEPLNLIFPFLLSYFYRIHDAITYNIKLSKPSNPVPTTRVLDWTIHFYGIRQVHFDVDGVMYDCRGLDVAWKRLASSGTCRLLRLEHVLVI